MIECKGKIIMQNLCNTVAKYSFEIVFVIIFFLFSKYVVFSIFIFVLYLAKFQFLSQYQLTK